TGDNLSQLKLVHFVSAGKQTELGKIRQAIAVNRSLHFTESSRHGIGYSARIQQPFQIPAHRCSVFVEFAPRYRRLALPGINARIVADRARPLLSPSGT